MHTFDDEVTCARCGEGVPVSCVRCRGCGAFLRPEIAECYKQLCRAPTPVIYSDLPEISENLAPDA